MNRRTNQAMLSAAAVLLFIGLFLFRCIGTLPDISVLQPIADGEAAVPIRNLNGALIYEYHSPTYGTKVQVPLSRISDALIAVTIATEDRTFFTNPGFSLRAIIRAFASNLMLRQTYSGASTITQQVVKNILLSPEERYERSLSRKAKEILLAAAVTLRYDKETILSLYLNEIYYGRNATGAEQASLTYFNKHASELSLEEAAFIAGLPQAPNYYGNDPEAGQTRQREVLWYTDRFLRKDGCIPVSGGKNPRLYCTQDNAENR